MKPKVGDPPSTTVNDLQVSCLYLQSGIEQYKFWHTQITVTHGMVVIYLGAPCMHSSGNKLKT